MNAHSTDSSDSTQHSKAGQRAEAERLRGREGENEAQGPELTAEDRRRRLASQLSLVSSPLLPPTSTSSAHLSALDNHRLLSTHHLNTQQHRIDNRLSSSATFDAPS